MEQNKNWWEPVFSGELEIGLNKEKLQDIEEETFLYYNQQTSEMESHL